MCVDDFALEAAEGAADHADAHARSEGAGDEFYGAVGGAEHEAEALKLGVGNDGGAGAGRGGAVHQETVDAGDADGLAALGLGAVDEYGGRDDDAVDLFAAAVAPYAQFALGGDVGRESVLADGARHGVLGVMADEGHIPVGAGYASGAVNAFARCRRRWSCLDVSHL